MQTLTKACAQVVERVERGDDVVLEGEASAVRAALDASARALEATHAVVLVTGPVAGLPLSLSGLIAQLSGRGNLDDHDDSALEQGVRRLTDAAAPGRRTVLVLDAPSGVHRSALRFLREVGRRAPDLIYVIAAFPEMSAMLAEPGMERLQQRLGMAAILAPNLASDLAAAAAPEPRPALASAIDLPVGQALPAVVTIPAEWRDLRGVPLSAREQSRRRRRSALWAASAIGMAASVTLGAWLGTRTGDPAPTLQASSVATYETVPDARHPAMAIAPAQVSAPTVVASAPPLETSGPGLASQMSALASEAAAVTVAGVGAAPTVVASAPPTAGAVPVPSPVAPARADLARATRPEIASAPAPGVVTSAVAEASLALDAREQSDDVMALAGLPREPTGGRPRIAPRPTRLASPLAEPSIKVPAVAEASTRLVGPAPEERRRLMSPRPQRLATLPVAPAGSPEARAHPRWHEEPLDDEAQREARAYANEQARAEQDDTPPVRYRRYSQQSEPAWRGERQVMPAEGQYIGTYEPGPYGARVFRYGP